MKPIVIWLCAFFLCHCLQAQTSKKIIIKAGQNAMEVLSTEIYHYPQFIKGTVFFKDGLPVNARLNYNLLVAQVQFIAPKGDTLSIADENTIKYITIGKDSFFYDQGYLKSIMANSSAKLAVKEIIKVLDSHKIGAYGQPSSRSIESYRSYSAGSYQYQLGINEDIILTKHTSYYLGDKFNHFLFANRKNLLKMFSKNETAIERFLKENDIDFNKEEDLKKVMVFLEGLSSPH